MAKKNALGEINLDFEESINTINGIPITPIKETKQEVEVIEDTESESEDLLSNILDAKSQKAIHKIRQERYDEINEEESKSEELKKLRSKVRNDLNLGLLPSSIKNFSEEEVKKSYNKPSTKKHLKEGYTRHTFAIKDEQLELIRAIAEYKGIEQKQLLESLLNKAFESIDENMKEEALTYLHNANKEDLDIFK